MVKTRSDVTGVTGKGKAARRAASAALLWAAGAAGAAAGYAQGLLTLGDAIRAEAAYLQTRMPAGTKVAALNVTAPTTELSDYIIEELTAILVNADKYALVDRRNLASLQREMNFQLSGEVSDETMQRVGHKVGAQTIVSGSFVPLGDIYRLRVRAIRVETAEVQGQFPVSVALDPVLASLIGAKYKDPAAAFSPGRKLGAAALNLFLGAGSFSMGDWAGGLWAAGGLLAAAGLVAWDIVGFERGDFGAGVPGAAGFALAGVTALYGAVRPFVYHPKTKKGGFALAPAGSGGGGLGGVSVSYCWTF